MLCASAFLSDSRGDAWIERMNMPKICLQQPIITDYRMGLFLLLKQEWGEDFQIYAGDADFGGSPVSTAAAWEHFQHVDNIYLLGGRFLWQKGCFRSLLSAEVAILNGNLRMLSNNLLLLLRKCLGRRTVLWGHAEGQNALAAALRGCYLRFCDGFIAYTESQAMMLRKRYPWLKVWEAPNSCVFAKDCRPVDASLDEVNSFLYVGRLVEKKKVRLLLDAFIEGVTSGVLNNDIRLVFVGDGAERSSLENRVRESGLLDRVEFVGHISNIEELRGYYARAICSVSPGYVGLSATQSFSFGVPMLIARDEFHSPEIESCKEGFSAEFFNSDSTAALLRELQRMAEGKHVMLNKREEVSGWAASHYSFEIMRDTFVKLIGSL